MTISQEQLTALLIEAEQAHAEYEKKLGHKDADWASWYAEFIIKKLAKDPEQEPQRQKVWPWALRLIAVAALVGLLYISGIRQLFFYQKTPSYIEQTPVVSQLDVQVISLPLAVYILQGNEVYGSTRSQADARRLVANAARIWQQADIALAIKAISNLKLEEEEFKLFMDSPGIFIHNQGLSDREIINVFLIKSLGGINGVSFGGLKSVAVADYTTVYDFRTLAHELGHVLGLKHVPADRGRLMYKGANSTGLSLTEIIVARQRVLEFFEALYPN